MSIFAADALKKEHALVTGATGGIGSETAMVLAEMGASITLTGRRANRLEELADEIREMSHDVQVYTYKADLCDEGESNVLVKSAEGVNGWIYIFVNDSGI